MSVIWFLAGAVTAVVFLFTWLNASGFISFEIDHQADDIVCPKCGHTIEAQTTINGETYDKRGRKKK